MIQTPKDYYGSSDNFGKYAYISMFEIVNELLRDTIDPDNYLTNTRRSRLVQKTKEGIRVLNRELKDDILEVEITVGPKLYLPLPQDFIDWESVSVVDANYQVRTLSINNNLLTAIGQLQDNNYDPLFDNNGEVLEADSSNVFNKKHTRYTQCPSSGNNGEFAIDRRRGLIAFSSNLERKSIVIQYRSDGLQMNDLKEQEITISKSIKEVLLKYVYMECIIGKRTSAVPQNEKYRAKQDYKAALHKAKLENLQFNISDIKSKSKPVDSPSNETKQKTIINESTSTWGNNEW